MSSLPRVALILTGGTIDSLGRDRLHLAGYEETGARLGPGELLARVPELDAIARVDEVPFARLSSTAIGSTDWLRLARLVDELGGQSDLDGIVISHGTNTLEETAFFLNLCLTTSRPVVLVGSMRPASALSSDADLNLVNAIRVAACRRAVGMGVLVVLNDTIHAAREVTKTATYRVQTFESRDAGPLGFADSDGQVVFYRAPQRAHTQGTPFDLRAAASLPRVDVVLSYAGQDGVMIEAAITAGARGLVSAGTGAGRTTPAEDAAYDRAVAQGIAVVQASRVGSGRVVATRRLCARGIIAADNLVPWKARILLMLGLTRTTDYAELQAIFDRC
jgi:L-asparaginase